MISEKISGKIDNIFWYCLIAFCGFAIFSIAVVQSLGVLLIVLFIFKKTVTGQYSLIKNPLNIPVLCFIASRILAVFLSENFNSSYPSLYREIAAYFLFFVFINEIDITNKDRIIWIIRILILAALSAAIRGIIIYLFIGIDRISSTTSGYYTLGMFLTAVFSMSIMLGRYNELFFKRIIWWAVNLILVTGILLTFDRVHWFAMTVAVLIAGILRERKMLVMYFLFGVAALLVSHQLLDRLMLLIRENKISERDVVWKGAYMLMWKHPIFGFGTRTFNEIFPLYNDVFDKGISSWHNDFLQVYMEGGIVGLGAFLFFIFSVIKSGFAALRNFKNGRSEFHRDLTGALLLASLSLLIGGFLLDPVISLIMILIISLIGLLTNYGKLMQQKG